MTFSERRNVKVLSDFASTDLTRSDCGRIFVLNSPFGHAVTLPSAQTAGEGWNCRFIVGAVQTDLTKRVNTTITVPGSEVVNAVLKRVAASASTQAGAAATETSILDTTGLTADNTPLDEILTITVPVLASGSGTAFSIKFVANNTDLPVNDGNAATPGNVAATFIISKETHDSDTKLRDAIIDCINGTSAAAGLVENTTIERPAAGSEGAPGSGGIKGITAAAPADAEEINITCDVVGAAASVGLGAAFVTDTNAGDGDIAIVKKGGDLAAGTDATGILVSGQTTTITPTGATIGDQLEFTVSNGQWFVRSFRAA